MSTLKEQFKKEIAPALKTQLGRKNNMDIPKILKITVNSGLNSKRDSKFIEVLQETVTAITGQKPVITKARKSEAGFKIRQGQSIGVVATLRGERMWNFLEKLVSLTFPRIRDFRGIGESSVDSYGNFNYGFKEHLAFPEVDADAIEQIHGLQVVITTTARTHEEGMALFKALGVPFKKADA